jgi:hypothetical protein
VNSSCDCGICWFRDLLTLVSVDIQYLLCGVSLTLPEVATKGPTIVVRALGDWVLSCENQFRLMMDGTQYEARCKLTFVAILTLCIRTFALEVALLITPLTSDVLASDVILIAHVALQTPPLLLFLWAGFGSMICLAFKRVLLSAECADSSAIGSDMALITYDG